MTFATVFSLNLLLVVSCISYSAQFNKSGNVALLKDKGGLVAPGFSCLLVNCSLPTTTCLLDSSCREAVHCNSECQGKTNEEACNLLCELTYGYNSSKYRHLLQCMSDHGCLPVSPPDGICVANDSSTIKNLTSLSQIKGKWWILRGLNCGQRGWPAAFDYFPCQRDEFVPLGTHNDVWVDHIAYCGGRNNTCSTPILYTVANVSITKPGVMNHVYTDPPLTPQIEEWRVLSWPHPDWMLYIYCGATPTGPYAGGSVVTRADSGKDVGVIPVYVEIEFRSVAKQFGFNYDEMCVSNVTSCSD
ncbi:PREDICTED: uncharacterized protein LOC109580811 [Amphimedon queenslandica]|uniref:VDE lipocalin domain-containing protein n=1 Tax=Amphimedon queenslandica TaxID=400682 RepID=A0A1X7V9X4_AMPQE|nr:PREDICTED: uncharacterized protein LOC109580811 [Amphimedon queenslandica]|eukprot:XP_019849923.1 PREDICTED: uncharacterized protein LOC109580811 [Amphimedon queenslandica]